MKTWDDIKTADDLIEESERRTNKITEQISDMRCPHLKKIDTFFYYCGLLTESEERFRPNPSNKVYLAKQSSFDIMMYCMGNFERCILYQNKVI